MNVVVVQGARQDSYDGWGDGHTIEQVLVALGGAGIEASTRTVGGASDLAGLPFDVHLAFPTARRYYDDEGQQRSLIALLREHDIRLVGSSSKGHAAAENKVHMKRALAAHAVPTPAWVLVDGTSPPATDGLRFPVVVKPEVGAMSLGVQRVDEVSALAAALKDVQAPFGPCGVLVEEWVREREFSVAVIGNGTDRRAFALEVVLPARYSFFSSEVKAQMPTVAPPLPVTDDGAAKRLGDIAIAACGAMEVRDWARVDILEDAAGDLYVIDINTMPGMRQEGDLMGGFPLCMNFGRSMTHGETILAIVGVALIRHGLELPEQVQAVITKLRGA